MCLTVFFLSDTPTFKQLQPWPEAVGILARGRASPGQRPWESWPEAVRVLARGRARGMFPGPVNVALLALELVSPSHSLPGDSLSRNSEGDSLSRSLEGGSQDMFICTPFPCIPDAQGVLLVMPKIEGLPKNVF